MRHDLAGMTGLLVWAALVAACSGGAGKAVAGGSTGGPGSTEPGSTGGSGTGGQAACGLFHGLGVTITGTVGGAAVDVSYYGSLAASSEGISGSGGGACAATFLLMPPVLPPYGGPCQDEGTSCDGAHSCCLGDCNGGTCGGPSVYQGIFQLPPGGAAGGQWYCAGNAGWTDLSKPDGDGDLVLSSLARLGPCPGAPVSGSVTVCAANDFTGTACSGAGSAMASTLAGAAFTWSAPFVGDELTTALGPGSFTGRFPVPLQTGDGLGSLLLIDYDHTPAAGTVTGGVLMIGPGNPDAGAVYCIGGGAMVEDVNTIQFTLTGLTRLGTCADAPVSGSLKAHSHH